MWISLLLLTLAQLLPDGDFDEHRLAACAESPAPLINEVCSVGTECDPDVRVADFIELYNPAARAVDLGCFAVSGEEDVLYVPAGELPPGQLRGFGEADLGFRIRKAGDEITLYRITSAPEGGPALARLESVRIDAEHALCFRSPDGGAWRCLPQTEAEYDWPASFDRPNATAGSVSPPPRSYTPDHGARGRDPQRPSG